MALRRETQELPKSAAGEIHTILGPESSFEGKLVFNSGTIRIDGEFSGEIKTEHTLIIGDTAHVKAKIEVGHIIITGEVEGDIIASQSVMMEKPGVVRGSVSTPELMIEKGVVFEGTSHMGPTQSGGTVTVLKDRDGKKA